MKNSELEREKKYAVIELRDYVTSAENIIDSLVDEIEKLENEIERMEGEIEELKESFNN